MFAIPSPSSTRRDFQPRRITGAIRLLGTWYALASGVLCPWLWYRGFARVETWLAGLATAAVPLAALEHRGAVFG
jgi:hypothetical protein